VFCCLFTFFRMRLHLFLENLIKCCCCCDWLVLIFSLRYIFGNY
jgi:hypothetical protein